ncbi:MAG: FAD:protein FMN transferase, partial [Clostridia bacterium]|nr:FAD:protein FMN transferase [Clostridia bacterium]
MDTVMRITLYGADQTLAEQAKEQILTLENLFSVTKPQSEIYKANHAQGKATSISAQTAQLLQTAIQLSLDTAGLFDCTVYPAVTAWGFTQNQNRVPTDEELQSILPLIGSHQINL